MRLLRFEAGFVAKGEGFQHCEPKVPYRYTVQVSDTTDGE